MTPCSTSDRAAMIQSRTKGRFSRYKEAATKSPIRDDASIYSFGQQGDDDDLSNYAYSIEASSQVGEEVANSNDLSKSILEMSLYFDYDGDNDDVGGPTNINATGQDGLHLSIRDEDFTAFPLKPSCPTETDLSSSDASCSYNGTEIHEHDDERHNKTKKKNTKKIGLKGWLPKRKDRKGIFGNKH